MGLTEANSAESSRIIRIDAFAPVSGHSFVARLPDHLPLGDSSEEPFCSELDVLENGRGLGPAHSEHIDIVQEGRGRFSHWHDVVYFSASDNSDPRSNGRDYHIYVPKSRERTVGRAIEVLKALSRPLAPLDVYSGVDRVMRLLHPDAKLGEDQKSYWRDDAFIAAYRDICGDNYRSLERKYGLHQLLGSLYWAAGDVAECGVYNGGSAYFMAQANSVASEKRQLFLFDSFEGLSEPSVADGDFWHTGDLRASETEVRRNLRQFANIHLYKGWIPTRFHEVADRQFCFVHVDVDLYQPTLDSIEFFYPRLQPGGMLVCDDYGFDSCPGARCAMDEYFADKIEAIIHLPTGQGVVVKRDGDKV